jgi:Conserved TM helix
MEDLKNGFGNAVAGIGEWLPKFVGFLVVLVVGYFVAKLLAKVVGKVLERVGFDKAVERGGVKKALEKSKFDASSLVGKVVFYIAFLFVLVFAFGLTGPNPISDLLEGVIAYLPNIVVAIVILVVGAAIAAGVKEIVEASIGGLSYGRTVAFGASTAVIVLAFFAALDQLQIAPRIVTGLFYGLLAIVVGSAVVAFGGGGIPVARRFLDRWAAKAEDESEKIKDESEGAKDRIKQRAEERKEQLKPDNGKSGSAGITSQQPSASSI